MTNRNKRGQFVSAPVEKENKMAMLVLTEAAKYMGIKPQAFKRIIDSPRNSVIFNRAMANEYTNEAIKVTHFHPSVPDLIEIDQAALDQYREARAHGKIAGTRSTRAGKPRKHTVYIPDALTATVYSYLDQLADQGVTYQTAYKARSKKTDTPVVSDAAQPVDLVEELIEA